MRLVALVYTAAPAASTPNQSTHQLLISKETTMNTNTSITPVSIESKGNHLGLTKAQRATQYWEVSVPDGKPIEVVRVTGTTAYIVGGGATDKLKASKYFKAGKPHKTQTHDYQLLSVGSVGCPQVAKAITALNKPKRKAAAKLTPIHNWEAQALGLLEQGDTKVSVAMKCGVSRTTLNRHIGSL
jgi:hypothetical protein